MAEIEWLDPPSKTLRRAGALEDEFRPIALALKEHPGRWARVRKDGYNGMPKRLAQVLGEGFEITQRRVADSKRFEIYVRWTGEAVKPKPRVLPDPAPLKSVIAPTTTKLPPNTELVFACADCDLETKSLTELADHVRRGHSRVLYKVERKPTRSLASEAS